MSDPANEEQVLCVARALVFPDGAWHGLVTTGLQRIIRLIRTAGEFRPRIHVEDDPDQQQIIPYCIVRHADGTYLLTRRLRKSTESRLHDLCSLGVGGHVNPEDSAEGDPLVGGLMREWREEVVCPGPAVARFAALLNDDQTPVSRVHLGLVFIVEPAPEQRVTVRETQKLAGERCDLFDLGARLDGMESWSVLAYHGLRDGTLLAAAAKSTLSVELPPAP